MGHKRVMDMPREQRAQGVTTGHNIGAQHWWMAQGAAEKGRADVADYLMGVSDRLHAEADRLAATLR